MKHVIVLIFAMLLLAGCGGDGGILSSRSSSSDSHDSTINETQTAEQEQSHNKQACVGLMVIGSCNTAQSNVQTASRQAPKVVEQPYSPAEVVGTLLALCVVFFFVVAFAGIALSSGEYNR